MKRKHLWVLNPCLLAMLAPAAWAEDQKAGAEEQMVVSASRSHRS
ncbi:TonB-dependent siderophore receptor, partial [Serratia marcescens subsp. marcescens ATCC 13880]